MIQLNPESSGKPLSGSKSPGVGYLYIAVIMFLAIFAGTLLSGGPIPVDPNGPGGPPTLPPYFAENNGDAQELIFTTSPADAKDSLQLKTFKVKTCASNAVVNFLIDTSASMKYDGKIDKLRNGLILFTKTLSPSSVIGMQTFSATVNNLVPLDYYKNNKSQVIAGINSLTPEGWTRMRDGFDMAKREILDATTKNKFPGYKYFLVLLSDGVPETPPPRTCIVTFTEPLLGPDGRCFTKEQDPRVPIDLAADLKNIKVEIYSIGIFGGQVPQSDTPMKPYLETLLKEVSSPPLGSHYFGTQAQAVNLEEVLKVLSSTLCQDDIGGIQPSVAEYHFPTFPHNATHAPYDPPGGAFE